MLLYTTTHQGSINYGNFNCVLAFSASFVEFAQQVELCACTGIPLIPSEARFLPVLLSRLYGFWAYHRTWSKMSFSLDSMNQLLSSSPWMSNPDRYLRPWYTATTTYCSVRIQLTPLVTISWCQKWSHCLDFKWLAPNGWLLHRWQQCRILLSNH